MTDLIDLAGKSVIVTGASSGIGASTARLLHAAGAYPVLAARRRRPASRAERGTQRGAGRAHRRDRPGAGAPPGDRHAPRPYQRIDGLVNNAGASLHGPLDQVDLAEFSQVLRLNVAGPLAVTQAVLPAMREQGFGRIVNSAPAPPGGRGRRRRLRVDQIGGQHAQRRAPPGTGARRHRGVAAAALDHRDRVRRRHVHPRHLAPAGHGRAQPGLRGRRGAVRLLRPARSRSTSRTARSSPASPRCRAGLTRAGPDPAAGQPVMLANMPGS